MNNLLTVFNSEYIIWGLVSIKGTAFESLVLLSLSIYLIFKATLQNIQSCMLLNHEISYRST